MKPYHLYANCMAEVIILEDDPLYQGYIERMIPEGLTCKIIGTSDELRECLRQNLGTTTFILDDKVPATPEGQESYQFLSNARAVLEANPSAQVWYTGSAPGPEEGRFCSDKGIKMIAKTAIREVLDKFKK